MKKAQLVQQIFNSRIKSVKRCKKKYYYLYRPLQCFIFFKAFDKQNLLIQWSGGLKLPASTRSAIFYAINQHINFFFG